MITGLWADGPCTVDGDHYSVHGLDGVPKPGVARTAPGRALSPRPAHPDRRGGRRIPTLDARRAGCHHRARTSLGSGRIDVQAGPSATHDATSRSSAGSAGGR